MFLLSGRQITFDEAGTKMQRQGCEALADQLRVSGKPKDLSRDD